MQRSRRTVGFVEEQGIVFLSVLIALILAQTDVLVRVLTSTKELELIGSFIAGMFFTSVFTTAPAMVTLGEIAQVQSLVLVALFGAAGAVVGDLIIFRFVKDRVSEHLMAISKEQGGARRMKSLLKRKFFRGFTFFLGGLIIASPLPDEIGISLMGISKMKLPLFVALSFMFNFIGIAMIGLAARAL